MKPAETVGRISGTSTASSIRPSGSIQRPSTGRKEKTPPNSISTADRHPNQPHPVLQQPVGHRCRDAGTARDSASN